MSHPFARAIPRLGLIILVGSALWRMPVVETRNAVPHYLRVSVAHWKIDTFSPEAERIFRQIETDGVAVFRAQPGFVRYRLMRENKTTTIAVAEWESETLGLAGAQQYRAWMQRVGIMDRLELETHTGQIVAGSD